MNASSFESDPNLDLDDRIKSSIYSLKELIVIFTGLTITASFAVFVESHFSLLTGSSRGEVSFAVSRDTWIDAMVLFLLILCVMRFYHGNIMILDRYYLIPKGPPKHQRSITLDSTAILLMTFGLAFLGLLIQHYVWFFVLYALITTTSVIWNGRVNWTNFKEMLGRRPDDPHIPDGLRDEIMTQQNWFYVNLFFLICLIFWSMVVMLTSTQPVVDSKDGALRINIILSNGMFWTVYAICLINSVLDLVLNRKEYFPRRQQIAT